LEATPRAITKAPTQPPIITPKKKVIFTCPLRALASEHFNEFKKKYSSLKIRCTLSTGDFDSSSKYLSNYDLIFTTNEKTESLLRHRAEWLSHIGALIVDEIHEIDSERGKMKCRNIYL
jgi:helicase